ncbi:MAG: methylated-DNA--[protein]-cysteine S-methyltransferase [Candidatus Schekmanbacteria bacterium]|nr:methylated-DNA--[protein]-cysteine S-methyltransferase [Candidatus Schekmanbacteria bacterium]
MTDRPNAYVFSTTFGPCGIAWRGEALTRVQLPESEAADVAAHVTRDGAAALVETPTVFAEEVAERLRRHLAGGRDPLQDIALDFAATTATRRAIFHALRRVAVGCTISYGELAAAAGISGGARCVGQAMAANPWPIVVPCHRVLAAGGRLGGYSGAGGLCTKLRLLTVEGFDTTQLYGEGIRHLRAADRHLAGVIDRVGPLRLAAYLGLDQGDAFTALAAAIVFQQVSVAAGRAIHARLLEAVGTGGLLYPGAVLAAGAERLRSCGLSARKATYICDLAAQAADGRLDLDSLARLDDDEVVRRLVALKGIGRWTVEMLLIFYLKRLDVFPVDDLGLRNAMCRLYALAAPPQVDELRKLAEPWRPFRSLATWYLWQYAALAKSDKAARFSAAPAVVPSVT